MNTKTTRIPAAAELIDAVAGFLEEHLLPTLEGSKRFNTRVSINTLRIVQRELSVPASESVARHLRQLPGSTDEEPLENILLRIAEQIRSKAMDENDPRLLAALRAHALDRLAVDNPKYAG